MTDRNQKRLLHYLTHALEESRQHGDFECERFSTSELELMIGALRNADGGKVEALVAIAKYSPASTVQPVHIARDCLKKLGIEYRPAEQAVR